ncbi:MAG: CoB--CoM heterodisulfide reductase iron-sulfur subunit B family protein [Candidatus Methanomethylicia archaeon]|nr:CoB--CoM heterodisulfide reductase iron-sulfur subunit B family protein [Candidatus Methanomethylicia archaeon]
MSEEAHLNQNQHPHQHQHNHQHQQTQRQKYGYFLGCVMPAKMPWAEKATFLVARHLGLDFDYMKETVCCVRPGVWKPLNPDWWLILTGQNLATAEMQKIIMVDSCNGCYISHYECLEELKGEPEKMEMVNRALKGAGLSLRGNLEIRHFLEVLYEDVGIERIRRSVVRPLKLRVTRHIGCHARVHGDRLLNYFDEVLRATGVEIVDTPYDRACCGLLLYLSDPATSIFRRAGIKLERAMEEKADGLVIICSGCYDQFERAVRVYKEERGVDLKSPVVHLSELLALSFGYRPEDFGMVYRRPIPVTGIIEKLKLKLKEEEGGR